MTATELANQVGVCSVVTLWIALVWRAGSALRLPNQRGLWLTVFAATIAITLFQPKVVAWLAHAGVGTQTVSLTRNLIGVLSAGLVLLFIVDSTRARHQRLTVIAGLVTALGSLLALNLLGDARTTAPAAPQGPATASSVYWLILVVAHLAGDAAAVVVCWPYSLRTADRDLVWSLRLFAMGSVLALVFWTGYLYHLYVPDQDLMPWLSVIISVHGLFRAASLLAPTATALARSMTALRTVWRLWPLWRDLVVAVPQVALADPQRTRLQAVLRPRSSWALQAHRQIIETYDALLELQQYVRPEAYDTAHRQASRTGMRGDRLAAAALAGALGEARRAKLSGAEPSDPCPLPGVERGSQATLLAIAGMWPSPTGPLPAAPGPLRPRRP
ncbi:MAB_1171c family putative transporter [Streptomyces durhamensis]|uniref:MAB_1171c family putative transporter n=1 Tax=Streptomyces durhamensis TaxID=68194 RepID=UPI000692134B|nr:MAB_1171c family putative transporter [Streptomyces durhamensis]